MPVAAAYLKRHVVLALLAVWLQTPDVDALQTPDVGALQTPDVGALQTPDVGAHDFATLVLQG
jgi:hypothetical protein